LETVEGPAQNTGQRTLGGCRDILVKTNNPAAAHDTMQFVSMVRHRSNN